MDAYQGWRDLLAGREVAISEDRPLPGYYRLKDRRPVAIWPKDGELVCRVADEMQDPLKVWTWCARWPVTKEDAKHAFEHGSWPGDVLSNSNALTLDDEIKDAAEAALAWLRAHPESKSKIEADTTANHRDKLLGLKKQAEDAHKSEKAPHLEAGRAVDAKFKPLIGNCDDVCVQLRRALTPWLVAEENRLKAEREARVREAMRNDAPLPLETPKAHAGGQRGKKTGLRTVTRTRVTDHAAALAHFAQHDDVRALVAKLADRLLKAGGQMPGAELYEERTA